MNRDFLRAVLSGQKRLLKLSEVNYICVPKYDEVSVRNLWGKLSNDEDFMKLMPTSLPKGRYPSREYVFNCLNTLRPDYCDKVVQTANQNRFSAQTQGSQDKNIAVNAEWHEALLKMPFISQVS